MNDAIGSAARLLQAGLLQHLEKDILSLLFNQPSNINDLACREIAWA